MLPRRMDARRASDYRWSRRVVSAGIEPRDGAGVMRVFFFFQAEDGIRDLTVTGVQTCALPISVTVPDRLHDAHRNRDGGVGMGRARGAQAGASRDERKLRAAVPRMATRRFP